MPRTTKALRFYRCLDDENQPFELEGLLRASREVLDTVARSEVRRADDVVRIQHYRDDDGIFLHLVRYVPGEASDTLSPGANIEQDDESQHPAPEGMEYKDGDFFLYCKGHNVIGCAHGMSMSVAKVSLYLKDYCRFAHVDEGHPEGIDFDFYLGTALNLEKHRLLERHGVGEIAFKASAYHASYHGQQQDGWLSSMRSQVGNSLRRRLERYEDEAEITILENLVVDASVKLKGNTRADQAAQTEMERMALEALDDDTVTIYTQKGEPITSANIKMQSKCSFEKVGKSIYYDSVWSRLRVYYNELERDRLLGQ